MNAVGVNGLSGDISGMGANSITIRAMRQLAFLCVAPTLGGGLGQITLTVRQRPIYGSRQTFSRGDSILVFFEGDPTTRNDDSWVRGEVKGVAAGTCPDPNGTPPEIGRASCRERV